VIAISNRSGRRLKTAPIRAALRRLLEIENRCAVEVSVLLCKDAFIQDLNRQYRNIDQSTDVLSFLTGDEHVLGDVVISVETAETQAGKRGIALEAELVYLALHGGLHLLGYDDQSRSGFLEMAERQRAVAEELGHRLEEHWESLHDEPSGHSAGSSRD
jgi:probable rRNA maturation factor